MLYPARWKKLLLIRAKSWKIYCSVFLGATWYKSAIAFNDILVDLIMLCPQKKIMLRIY